MKRTYRNGLLAGIPIGIALYFVVVLLLKAAGEVPWMLDL